MSTPIPVIRQRLIELADKLHPINGDELRELVGQMYRKPAVRVTRNKLPALTEEKAASIRGYAASRPSASQLDIANVFGVNPGRVSEALNHKR